MTPSFLGTVTGTLVLQLLVSGLLIGSTYALLGVSFNVIYSTTGRFHFAHALVYTAGAYGAVVARQDLGSPLWLSALFGLLVGVVLGVAIEVGPYRSLARHGSTPLAIFLASLGLTIAGTNLFQVIFGPDPRVFGGFPLTTINLGSIVFTNLSLVSALVSWAVIAMFLLFLRLSRLGTAIRAVQSNVEMAKAVGIRQLPIFAFVFAIGSLMMALAGVLFAMGQVASPTMGMFPIVIALVGAFVGGIGSMPGAAIGGLFVGLAANVGQLWLTSDTSVVLVFGLLFLVLVVRPQGFLGRARA